MQPVDTQIAYWMLRVRIERMRRLVKIMLERRAMKFTFLSALGSELEKLGHEIEEDARKIIQKDIPATRARKKSTFDNAQKHIGDANQALTDVNGFFDALDKATNGGPILGGSSQSPVNANPAETAGLPEVK